MYVPRAASAITLNLATKCI